MFRWTRFGVLAACLLAAGCENKQPPSPSPGNGTGETITGGERIGWDQRASDTAELATFRYAIYVDGARSELADATCASAAGANGFPCSGRIPAMAPGTHTLELAAFVVEGGTVIESAKSPPLAVTVTGATAPAASEPLRSGDSIVTADGLEFTAGVLASGLDHPTALSVSPDGLLFIATRDGQIRIRAADGRVTSALAVAEARQAGGIRALALDPEFPRTRHVFVVYAAAGTEARLVFTTARYREHGGRLLERMIVLPDVSAGPERAAALRFGPDAKLYAAFDDGGDPEMAGRLSEWSGKILRLEPDGRTPVDQPAASPVFWSGLTAPRGLTWTADASILWSIDDGADGVERIRGIGAGATGPLRAAQRASYVLPRPLGARALTTHPGGRVPEFAGDLLVAARAGGYLLRIRLDRANPARVVSSERLLEGRLGAIRCVAADADGGIYVASSDAVWKLTAVSDSRARRE